MFANAFTHFNKYNRIVSVLTKFHRNLQTKHEII